MSDFAFSYEHCDIPEGTTLREHRAAARRAPRRHGLRQVIQVLLPGQSPNPSRRRSSQR